MTINVNLAQADCIFPFFKEFVTNHLIIRGNWEKITLCIYGLPVPPAEAHKLTEQAKSDISLESLIKMEEAENPENTNFTKEEIDLLNKYKVDQLISPYIKCELIDDFRKAYFINPPNLSMVEKTRTGFIYYEKELNFCIQCLNNFYVFDPKISKSKKLTVNSQGYLYLSGMEGVNTNIEELNLLNFQSLSKKLIDLMTKLISNNNVFLENECVFNRDNYQIYLKFPEMLVDIVMNALYGRLYGYIEIRYALKLLKLMANSAYLTDLFVEKNGMELLYGLLLGKDCISVGSSTCSNNVNSLHCHQNTNINYHLNYYPTSSVITVSVLENVYKLLTHKSAFIRFIENNEKNKNNQVYFMIKDILKEAEKENVQNMTNLNSNNTTTENVNNILNTNFNNIKEIKLKERDEISKEDEENKKKDRQEKKSKRGKKKSRKDRKNSRSRSKSRSKSRTISKSRNSVESNNSAKKKSKLNNMTASPLTAQTKNLPLKNGYQILLTILLQKNNQIIYNMIKKIMNKITFLIYLRELGQITELLVISILFKLFIFLKI